jgi:hypothetical protein
MQSRYASRATNAEHEFANCYDVVCALLAADRSVDSEATEHTPRHRQEIKCPQLWENLVDKAEYHGLAPLLEPTISALARDMPAAIPNDVRRAFVALARRHRRAAVIRERCIDELLTAFATASIPVILLKGAALAHLVYPAPKLRPMADIDVLIDSADLEGAIRTVCDIGYSFAPRHVSRFAGQMHHLPAATTIKSGFEISLEIHLDAMSPDVTESLTFASLSTKPRPFQRGSGPAGLALGHTDMLRHLARHAFEPARCVPLKHLNDLWRYQMTFADEIDWRELEECFPQVIIVLKLVSNVFMVAQFANPIGAAGEMMPAGVGIGMVPLSEIAKMPFAAMLSALFNPSAWWLHGYYGVPLGKSLLVCRTIRHPLTLARWFARRMIAAMFSPSPFSSNEWHEKNGFAAGEQ